jgi:hypothetical protein
MGNYEHQLQKFCEDIGKAINANDKNQIKDIINSDLYQDLALKEKESQAFISAYISYNEPILNYLIFDYKIKEENSLAYITEMRANSATILEFTGLKKEIIQMFSIRKINEDLLLELKQQHNPLTNKIKI